MTHFALAERNVPPALVLDELDVNFTTANLLLATLLQQHKSQREDRHVWLVVIRQYLVILVVLVLLLGRPLWRGSRSLASCWLWAAVGSFLHLQK